MEKTEIFGIQFDNVTLSEAAELAMSYVEKGEQALAVTPNAEIMQASLDDENVKKALLSAEIVLPDGEGVVWAAKKLGSPLKQKVAGVEFGMECARICAEKGYSMFLLGGREGVAENAAKKLCFLYPKLNIIGVENGYFKKDGAENEALTDRINKSGTDVLYVCLGAPAQEKWVYQNRKKLKSVRLIACLGGSLDIYAGTAKRAPRLFISLRLEWLYRLLRQPSRAKRMTNLPRFMISVYKYKRKLKKNEV